MQSPLRHVQGVSRCCHTFGCVSSTAQAGCEHAITFVRSTGRTAHVEWRCWLTLLSENTHIPNRERADTRTEKRASALMQCQAWASCQLSLHTAGWMGSRLRERADTRTEKRAYAEIQCHAWASCQLSLHTAGRMGSRLRERADCTL